LGNYTTSDKKRSSLWSRLSICWCWSR